MKSVQNLKFTHSNGANFKTDQNRNQTKSSTSMEQNEISIFQITNYKKIPHFNGTNYKMTPEKSITKIPPLKWNKIKIYIRQNSLYTSNLIDFQNYYKISHSDGIKIK